MSTITVKLSGGTWDGQAVRLLPRAYELGTLHVHEKRRGDVSLFMSLHGDTPGVETYEQPEVGSRTWEFRGEGHKR